ncbi:MAG: Hpt domain-containing protein [Planctomycetales bacterium]|nr:Hpt domain-containing protein [Planctomycetales bacterium]
MTESQRTRFSAALQRLGGDEETLVLLAGIASEDAPQMISRLETEVQEDLLPQAALTAHALKGLLSAFETAEPVSTVQNLIDTARAGDAEALKRQHDEITPKLCNLVREIASLADVSP